MIKIQAEGKVTRIYTEERGQRTTQYVVIDESAGGRWPNVLRFRTRNASAPTCSEGDTVKLTAYVDGRKWTNPRGQTMYFTDFTIDACEVVTKGAGAPTDASGVKSWDDLLAFAAKFGKDKNAVAAECKATGKAFKAFTPADWQAIAKSIATPADEFDGDDCPF